MLELVRPKRFASVKSFFKWIAPSQLAGRAGVRSHRRASSLIARLRIRFGTALFAERKMVGVTGVEPVTLRLSSACSNQLSYTPNETSNYECRISTCARSLSNDESNASFVIRNSSFEIGFGGAEEIRTPDLQLAKLPLYQLSYSPEPSVIYDFGFTRSRPRLASTVNCKS